MFCHKKRRNLKQRSVSQLFNQLREKYFFFNAVFSYDTASDGEEKPKKFHGLCKHFPSVRKNRFHNNHYNSAKNLYEQKIIL